MMRYSFSDFLKYQNELNNNYCQETVDAMIDSILNELKRKIEQNPTIHAAYFGSYYDTDHYAKSFYRSSLKQLKAVKEYFENMGFTIEYLRDYESHSPFNDSVNSITGFALTW